jgi:SDR family mycofactocin-dependent oxidoreductase
MGTLEGKVAFITGGARGQGRSHAVRLAEEGADIVVADICAPIESVPYELATKADLEETVSLVERLGRRVVGITADIRDYPALAAAAQNAVETFGRLDIVLANAGIAPMSLHDHDDVWRDVIDVNLAGTFNTVRAAAPVLISGGAGGSIVLTSSGLGLSAYPTDSAGALAYIASKHGIIGLMRAYANTLAPHRIRVNAVLPSGVSTPMVNNPAMAEFVTSLADAGIRHNTLPVELLEEIDISNAIAWLVSDDARYVTGTTLAVDAGYLNSLWRLWEVDQ